MVQEIQIFSNAAMRTLDVTVLSVCLQVFEILVVYFGKIMRFDVLAVMTMEQ